MIVHSDNQKTKVQPEGAAAFDAWCSHVENPDGKHLFVVAVAPPARAALVAARGVISSFVKKYFGIQKNADLGYVEHHSDGSLYQVNLDNIGRGPGMNGEAEHIKEVVRRVPWDKIQTRLGNVKIPREPENPKYVEVNTDLNQRSLSRFSNKERSQEQKILKKTQKPKL